MAFESSNANMVVFDYPESNDDTETLVDECFGFATNHGLFLTADEENCYLFFEKGFERPQIYHCAEGATIGDELIFHFSDIGYELKKVFKTKEDFVVTLSYST